MTTLQICALITIIVTASLLYWSGYRGGLADRHIGGTKNRRYDSVTNTRELEAPLQLSRIDHHRLALHCKKLEDRKALDREHHEILLDIAEKLRIAAETFSAFRTGKKLEREARTLSEQALTMAALVGPATKEDAV